MRPQLFAELVESIKEAGHHLRQERQLVVEDMFMTEGGKYYYRWVQFSKDGKEVQLDGWFSADELKTILDVI